MKYAPGLADGSINLSFRRWNRPQAIAGNTYRTAAGRVFVDSVSVVVPERISDAEATRAGYESAAALVADLRGTADLLIYRVALHLDASTDPRDELAASVTTAPAENVAIRVRLERLDVAGRAGPWTARTLALISANPAVRAGDLAPRLGQELLDFKLNVRKLKALGLTISLGTGYRISARGESYLAWRQSL